MFLPVYKENLIRSGFYLKRCLLLARFNFAARTANKTYLNTYKGWESFTAKQTAIGRDVLLEISRKHLGRKTYSNDPVG